MDKTGADCLMIRIRQWRERGEVAKLMQEIVRQANAEQRDLHTWELAIWRKLANYHEVPRRPRLVRTDNLFSG